MAKNIVIIGSLDSKGLETAYLKKQIEAKGAHTILVDIGIGGEPTITPDISSDEIAKAGGGDIHEIRASRDTGKMALIMIKGANIKVQELLKKGKLDGIISFGGVSNTTSATTVMKTLPFGIPKFMISSSASMPAYAASFIGTKDITMMHSVVDISDLNDLTKAVLERAAGGICGMAEASSGAVEPQSDAPLIAVTSFKFCEACSQNVKDLLESKGYTVIIFHANGIGDMAMEELLGQGLCDGIIDVVPAGVFEEMIGGNRAAGPERLEAAGLSGIPQVITPSGFDMISCGPLGRRDEGDALWTDRHLGERKIFVPDEFRVQVRSNGSELEEIAQEVARKLNGAKGSVRFFIPTLGWSSLSVEGADLCEPETDAVFAPALRSHLKSDIEVIEKDLDYASPQFAEALVDALIEMMN